MRKLALALGCALVIVPSAQASQASDAKSVRLAVLDFKSGLRHNDGEKACGRMTLRLRTKVLGAVVKAAPSLAGSGCVNILNIYGREIYNELGTLKLNGLRVHGRCADWTNDGSSHAAKQDGRWKLAGDGLCK